MSSELAPSYTGLGLEDRQSLALALADLEEVHGRAVYESPGFPGIQLVGRCRLSSPAQAATVVERLEARQLLMRNMSTNHLWFSRNLAVLVTDQVRVRHRLAKSPYDKQKYHRALALLRHIYLASKGRVTIGTEHVMASGHLANFYGVKVKDEKELKAQLDYLELHDQHLITQSGRHYTVTPKAEWVVELADRRRLEEQMSARLKDEEKKPPVPDRTPPPIVVPASRGSAPRPSTTGVNWITTMKLLSGLDPELWVAFLSTHSRRSQWGHNLVLLLVSRGENVTGERHAELWERVAAKPNRGFADCFASCATRGFVRKEGGVNGSPATLVWIHGQLPIPWQALVQGLIDEAGNAVLPPPKIEPEPVMPEAEKTEEPVFVDITGISAFAPLARPAQPPPEPAPDREPEVQPQTIPGPVAETSLADQRWIAFLKQHPDRKQWDEYDLFFFLTHRGEFLTVEAAKVMEQEFGTGRMRVAGIIYYSSKKKEQLTVVRLGLDKRSGSRAHWDQFRMAGTWWVRKLTTLLREFGESPVQPDSVSVPEVVEIEPEAAATSAAPEPSPPHPRTMPAVVAIVADHYGLEPWDLTLPDSSAPARWPRKVAMYFLYQYFDRDQRTIGMYFSRRQSPVVSINIKDVRAALSGNNQKFKEDIAELKKKLGIKE